MKKYNHTLSLIILLLSSCVNQAKNENREPSTANLIELDTITKVVPKRKIIDSLGITLETRIFPPANFQRIIEDENSYSTYLRGLPLKPHGSDVLLYDGTVKGNGGYDAVIDMKIGDKDLHQCADAVMRLRAEYLWEQKRYNDIHFNLTNGFKVGYTEWMKGKRIAVKGNKSYWIDKGSPSNTYQDFWSYMELIFNYAGTLSLSKELMPVAIENIKIGDVFIWGGTPGHAVLVIDLAINSETKEKVFLLAQSYMPAQETHILQNPNNDKLSPWYLLSEIGDELTTPEWTFNNDELKRFREE